MLRRIISVFALAALAGPAVVRADEWEEDYTNDGAQSEPPPADDDYPVSVDDAPPPSIETFQSSLAPYGEWVVVGGYGRVWRPHVAAGWRPYYYGRWEWTHEGWLWVSDEPFGWAAYHYGRWAVDPGLGWIWVPGSEWAPAWVSWRYSGDVVGWAPLGPGVSVYVATTPFVDTWWTFVPCHRFVAEPVYRVAYQPAFTRRYFYETQPAPPRPGMRPAPGRPVLAPAWGGPPPRAIEQRIGRPITPMRVVAAPSPGAARVGAGEVSVFRPGLRPGAPMARPAPPVRAEGPGRFQTPGRAAAPPRPDAPARAEAPGRAESPGRVEPGRGQGFHPAEPPGRGAPPVRAESPQDRPHGWSGGGAPPAQGLIPTPQPRQGMTPAPSQPRQGMTPAPSQPRQDRGGGFAPRGWPGAGQGGGGRAGSAPPSAAPRDSFRPRAPEPRREAPAPRMGRDDRWHR